MRFIRLCAQIIDILVCFVILIAAYLFIPSLLSNFTENTTFSGVMVFVLWIVFSVLIQYPFLRVGQTVGKGFFGLRIVTTVPERPITISILIQREIFCKLFTCYFICIPMLTCRPGGHEVATQTEVVRK